MTERALVAQYAAGNTLLALLDSSVDDKTARAKIVSSVAALVKEASGKENFVFLAKVLVFTAGFGRGYTQGARRTLRPTAAS